MLDLSTATIKKSKDGKQMFAFWDDSKTMVRGKDLAEITSKVDALNEASQPALLQKLGCPWYGDGRLIICYVASDIEIRPMGYSNCPMVYVTEASLPEISRQSQLAFGVDTTLETFTTIREMPEMTDIIGGHAPVRELADGTKVYADISGWIIKE